MKVLGGRGWFRYDNLDMGWCLGKVYEFNGVGW